MRATFRNHLSAATNNSAVREFIGTEKAAGRLIGPIDGQLVHISPVGLVPKGHQIDKFRMIVDLSFPRGHSINDGISTDLSFLTYCMLQ